MRPCARASSQTRLPQSWPFDRHGWGRYLRGMSILNRMNALLSEAKVRGVTPDDLEKAIKLLEGIESRIEKCVEDMKVVWEHTPLMFGEVTPGATMELLKGLLREHPSTPTSPLRTSVTALRLELENELKKLKQAAK